MILLFSFDVHAHSFVYSQRLQPSEGTHQHGNNSANPAIQVQWTGKQDVTWQKASFFNAYRSSFLVNALLSK